MTINATGNSEGDLSASGGRSVQQCRSDPPITIYTSESPLRDPAKFIAAMSHDLFASRELAWQLFIRDTRAQYRKSLLGYFWIFIPPLITALPFIFLNSQGVIRFGETPLPYGAFALIGTMIWQVFADAVNSPIRSISSAAPMMTRINFPREALLVSGLLQVGLSFLVRLLLLALVLAVYGIIPPVTAIFFPFGILALVLAGFSIGLIVAPLGLLYGDVQRGIAVLLPFWMLLTPVLYPKPQSGLAGTIASFNPVTPILTTTRDWLTLGTTSNIAAFLGVVLVTASIAILGWIVIRVALPHIIARFGN